jgi:hypothetical protein
VPGRYAGLAANEAVHAIRTAVSIARLDMMLVTAFSSLATLDAATGASASQRLHVEERAPHAKIFHVQTTRFRAPGVSRSIIDSRAVERV